LSLLLILLLFPTFFSQLILRINANSNEDAQLTVFVYDYPVVNLIF